jgi:hypothetical protein
MKKRNKINLKQILTNFNLWNLLNQCSKNRKMSKVEDFLTKEDEQEIVEAIRMAEKKHFWRD